MLVLTDVDLFQIVYRRILQVCLCFQTRRTARAWDRTASASWLSTPSASSGTLGRALSGLVTAIKNNLPSSVRTFKKCVSDLHYFFIDFSIARYVSWWAVTRQSCGLLGHKYFCRFEDFTKRTQYETLCMEWSLRSVTLCAGKHCCPLSQHRLQQPERCQGELRFLLNSWPIATL